nr:hypothetical protein [uncultured bacterium]
MGPVDIWAGELTRLAKAESQRHGEIVKTSNTRLEELKGVACEIIWRRFLQVIWRVVG